MTDPGILLLIAAVGFACGYWVRGPQIVERRKSGGKKHRPYDPWGWQ